MGAQSNPELEQALHDIISNKAAIQAMTSQAQIQPGQLQPGHVPQGKMPSLTAGICY